MITGEIKSKVDQIWEDFWTGGITNSISVLEQMTYLFFMKMLDDAQIKAESNANLLGTTLVNPTFPVGQSWHNPETDQDIPYERLRWYVFKNDDGSSMFQNVRMNVFPFIKNLNSGRESAYSRFMENATFLIPKARTLVKVVEGVDVLDMNNRDTMGDVYEYVLGSNIDKEVIAKSLTKIAPTKKTELLFVALFTRMLQLGGRCASIVPDGVLFGTSSGHKAVRKELVDNQRLQAVISMPSGVFKPYAGVSTAILIFTKTNSGGTDKVWFYDMRADGFSLDDKRNPVSDNDIPDIIRRYEHLEDEATRTRKDQSFLVPVDEIRQNDYDLSINKYKEVERVKVEYEPTATILARLEETEQQIEQGLKELKEMLKENDNG